MPSDFSPSLLPEARAEKASDTTSAQSSAGGLQAQAHDGGTDSPGPKTEAALNSAPMEMQSSGLAEEERLQDQSLGMCYLQLTFEVLRGCCQAVLDVLANDCSQAVLDVLVNDCR